MSEGKVLNFKSLVKSFDKGKVIPCIVESYDTKKKEFSVRFGNGLVGIMPLKDYSLYYSGEERSLDIEFLFSRSINVKIVSLNPVIVSRRLYMQEEFDELKDSYDSSKVIEAKIIGIAPNTHYISCMVGTIRAYISASNYFLSNQETLSECIEDVVCIGDTFKCKITCITPENELCLRRNDILQKTFFHEGDIVKGIFHRHIQPSAYVELPGGIWGFASRIPSNVLNHSCCIFKVVDPLVDMKGNFIGLDYITSNIETTSSEFFVR